MNIYKNMIQMNLDLFIREIKMNLSTFSFEDMLS